MRKLRISDNIGALAMYTNDIDGNSLKGVRILCGNKEKIGYRYYDDTKYYAKTQYDFSVERIDCNLKKRALNNSKNVGLLYSKCKIRKTTMYGSKIL